MNKKKNVMKTLKLFTLLLTVALLFVFVSCDDNIEEPDENETILPERFSIDVPGSISNPNAANGRSDGRIAEDGLNGNEIYKLLSLYIAIGDASGDLIEAVIGAITVHGINHAMTISYESDEDGRTKNMEVIEGASYNGVSYEFMLTATDAESENSPDGGKAMQIFWNRSPIKGVAILKPYNIDRVKNAKAGEVIYMIEYNEESDLGYDAHMIVTIDDLPLADPQADPYSISTLKMFVGKSGDNVDVYGNSNHPNAKFFTTDDVGFNWAFVASGSESAEIGVAEVGLPPSNLDETSRSVLLEDYSIKQVFTDQITSAWPNIGDALLDQYLHNTEAPGFFNNDGFIQGGTSPGEVYDPLVTRIQELAPYNPSVIASLEISFQ